MANLNFPLDEEDLSEVDASAPLWMVSFADLSLLMLSFFIFLLATSNQEEVYDEDIAQILASISEGIRNVPKKESTREIDVAILQVLSRQQQHHGKRNKLRWTSPAVEGQLNRHLDLKAKAKSRVGRPIIFPKGSAEITSPNASIIEEIAAVVRPHYRDIIIEGHCSREEGKGFTDNGRQLSYQRALAVEAALVAEAVLDSRIRIVVCGDRDTSSEPGEDSILKQRAVVTLGTYFVPGDSRYFERSITGQR